MKQEKEDKEDKVEEKTEEKEEISSQKETLVDKIKENPWKASTVVLGIIGLMLLFSTFSGLTGSIVTGSIVNEETAGDTLVNLAKTQIGDIEIISVERESGLYKISYSSNQGESYMYMTLDGKNLVNGLIPVSYISENEEEETSTSTEVPKSNKPVVGLYIWSYCPYGVTALGPFAEVASLLENNVDFKVYLYYSGHGDFEVQQNKIQACIQELGYDAYWDYAEGFANEIYDKCYGDIDCDLSESVALMDSLGIDSDKVLACVESKGEELLEEHYNAAKDVGVTGSPSLVVNGVKVSVSRTAEAYKNAICESFNDAPKECNTELSSTGTTTSGSC